MAHNILPYDGEVVLIDESCSSCDWNATMDLLLATIPWRQETARIFGKSVLIPRMTAWFGQNPYHYSGIRHQPAAFPTAIDALRKHAEALSGAAFNAVLANLYRDGADSVAWHSDAEASLGDRPTIASLSLGAARDFQLQHKKIGTKITLHLKAGHWLVMSGETQRFWLHQLPKSVTTAGARINLTFRRMV